MLKTKYQKNERENKLMKTVSYSAIKKTINKKIGYDNPAITLAVVSVASRESFDVFQAYGIARTYAPLHTTELLAIMVQYFFEDHVDDRIHMVMMEVEMRAKKHGINIDKAWLADVCEKLKALMLSDVYSAASHAISLDTMLWEVVNRMNKVTFSYLKAIDYSFLKA
jgi:hypothetical protein